MKLIKNYWIIIIILLFSLSVASSLLFVKGKNVTISSTAPLSTPAITKTAVSTTLSYKGEASKSALTLLKAHATIEQASSGLVTAINGRKADDAKHEYWAFYVNGKLASVGPSDYITKDSDTILWRIDTY